MRKKQSSFSSSARFLSSPFLIGYLVLFSLIIFSPFLANYFVADDFTWLHWVSQCSGSACSSVWQLFLSYFLQSGDFFYRPGMKIYFYLISHIFGSVPLPYHVISLVVHILCSILVFLLAKKILKNQIFAFAIALSFSLLASHAETIMWVSSIGHLFASLFILLSLYLFILWKEKRRFLFLIGSVLCTFLAPLFHEYGVIAPILVFAFDLVWYKIAVSAWKEKLFYLWYIFASAVYFFLKIASHSFWSAGDYKYDLPKLPFNAIGNSLGDMAIGLLGNPVFVVYNNLRSSLRAHLSVAAVIVLIGIILVFVVYKYTKNIWNKALIRHFLISFIFLLVPLLPFLGLGNTAMRYVYVSSFGSLLLVTIIFQTIIKKWSIVWNLIIGGLLLVFLVYQVVQLQVSYHDWWTAGKITQRFVVSMQHRKAENIKAGMIFIANVPYTYGQAWIFPAGLADAVWLANGERDIHVTTIPSSEDAPSMAKKSKVPVYEFQPDGSIKKLK